MACFEVINVGQGDSMILRPHDGCTFSGETIFIDLGPGNHDITAGISSGENVHIFLTHHDNDHLGGLRFFIGKMQQVSEITVPLYQNEITLIARAILNLKGINTASDCNEFTKALEEIVNNQVLIKTLVEGTGTCPKLSFAYENKDFCNHIVCLNPPMLIDSYDWIREANEVDLINMMKELFTITFAREMEIYIRANRGMHRIVDSREFNSFWLYMQEGDVEIYRAKCNYVLDFIISNIGLLRKFNNKSTRENLKEVYKNYVKCTHDVCIVLKTSFENETMLHTGDASKKVFKRLMQEGKDISASYLKMPHHGSNHNMNKKILEEINPKVAIISHNNGRFGKAKDPHPNKEVLNMLQSKNIKILITNDIIKEGIIVMEKNKHKKDFYVNIL